MTTGDADLSRMKREEAAAWKTAQNVICILCKDVEEAQRGWAADPSNQFWARTTIRALMACIEGFCWHLRQISKFRAAVEGIALTAEEVVLIEEKFTDRNGTQKRKYPRFEEGIKATFSLHARVLKIPFQLDLDENFKALCRINKKRDGLMHPKNVFSLGVSDADRNDAIKGRDWINVHLSQLKRNR